MKWMEKKNFDATSDCHLGHGEKITKLINIYLVVTKITTDQTKGFYMAKSKICNFYFYWENALVDI